MKSQSDRILNHLRCGKSVTALQALYQFDCLRLAARINGLRQSGHNIQCHIVTDAKTGKRFGVYKLVGLLRRAK